MTARVNRHRIQADEHREHRRWLSEQRLRLYIEAQRHQRDLVFIADGVLRQRMGGDHAAVRADPDRYQYFSWMQVFDQLEDSAAGLRLLGADVVADHLVETMKLWRASEVRQAIKENPLGETGQHLALPAAVRKSDAEWWGSHYLNRVADSVSLGRSDIDRLGPNSSTNRGIVEG